MKERPILFNGEMVRAILEGRKTQTRRSVKPQPSCLGVISTRYNGGFYLEKWPRQEREMGNFGRVERLVCKYGTRGDQFWVKETFWPDEEDEVYYRASEQNPNIFPRWKPSIFMRRAYSRIQLEIEIIRVERLNEISEADAIAEGVQLPESEYAAGGSAKNAYRSLWESINGPGSWAKNPWVWVIEFKRQ